jgi:hypothetical protein
MPILGGVVVDVKIRFAQIGSGHLARSQGLEQDVRSEPSFSALARSAPMS